MRKSNVEFEGIETIKGLFSTTVVEKMLI